MNALNFLQLFSHEKYTLAYLRDGKMRSFPCAASNLEAGLKYLKKENKNHEIYFMVNEGNGVLNAAKSACHSNKNVINISAIFLDAELENGTDPRPAITEFCLNYFVQPTVVVESSPNRYHYYWLLSKTDSTPNNIYRWKQIQAFLHSKLSIDRTMTDTPQVLRIPGFKNIKRNCDVKIIEHDDQNYHDFAECYDLLLKNFPEIKNFKAHTPLPTITEDYKVPEGERHEELLRRLRRVYGTGSFTDEEVRCFSTGFIFHHVQNPRDFLPNGKRAEEVERILSAAKSYHIESEKQELANRITKYTATKKGSPFELDPDFFYQAPGTVGELTRHIVDTSRYPIPAHAFAAAVSLTGLCKARYTQGESSLPPLNYFLCLAPSAAGKTSIQTALKQTMMKLQITHLLEDGIASSQGLLQFLFNSGGLGMILYDESKELFQTIQHRNAASYEIKIASELTKLYTAYGSYYTPPTTKTHKGQKVILKNPLFSFLGYGHRDLIDTLFTKASIQDGLLPRFLILSVDNRTSGTPVTKPVPSHILDKLRYHLTKSNLIIEEKAKQAGISIDTTPTIKKVPLCADALPSYQAFELSTNRLYDTAVQSGDGLEAIFSRSCEQSLRLALALSDTDCIDKATLDFCIHLADSQQQDFHQRFSKAVTHTKLAKEVDILLETLVDMIAAKPDTKVTKQSLRLRVRHRYDSPGLFDRHLQELIEEGRVVETRNPGAGRPSYYLSLGEVLGQ